jgi:antitoxin (DNA-binding transcriptional repressor) of toxin-antitoxin stability system
MGHAQTIQTVTSREFAHNASAAKRVAAKGRTVIITDRGEPAFALLNIAEYRRLTKVGKSGKSILELLRMPEADAYDFDPDPVRFEAQDIE